MGAERAPGGTKKGVCDIWGGSLGPLETLVRAMRVHRALLEVTEERDAKFLVSFGGAVGGPGAPWGRPVEAKRGTKRDQMHDLATEAVP